MASKPYLFLTIKTTESTHSVQNFRRKVRGTMRGYLKPAVADL